MVNFTRGLIVAGSGKVATVKKILATHRWMNVAILLLLLVPLGVMGMGRALGWEYRAAPALGALSAPHVAIVARPAAPSAGEVEAMVREGLGLALGAGGMGQIVRPGDTVVMKVNLGVGLDAHEITSWQVVRAVVLACQEAGAGRIIIGESPEYGLDHFNQAGYTAHITGVEYLDFSAATMPRGIVAVPLSLWPEGEDLILPQAYLQADVVISIPKMKTHNVAGVTAGLKNVFGVAPLDLYRSNPGLSWRDIFHNEFGVPKTITHINLAKPPSLVVVDAILAGEGLGPWNADPVAMNMILVGRDAVATDAVAAATMGFDPTRVRHLVYSAYYGLGQNDLSQIEIVGAPLNSVRRNFDPPGTPAQVYRRGTVIAAPPAGLVLDGDLGEWAGRVPLMVNQAEHVQDGRSDWSGAADASVSAWVAYDDRYLYLAARVWDDVRIPNAGGPGSIWNGDALELYFSGAEQDARGRTAGYLASDFRLGVGYGQVRLCDIGRGRALSAQIARRELADGYALELRIPWGELDGFVPSRNYEIGLDIALDDADTLYRDSQLIWGGTANLPEDVREMGIALLSGSAPAPTPTSEPPTLTPTATRVPSTATPTPKAQPSETSAPTPTHTAAPVVESLWLPVILRR